MVGAYTDAGVLVNSGDYTGMTTEDARQALYKAIEDKGIGHKR